MDTPRLTLISLGGDTPLPRADFLRALSAALAVAALEGCSGPGPTGPGDPADPTDPSDPTTPGGGGVLGTPGTPVTAAQRLDSLGRVEAEVARLVGAGERYEPAALLTFLRQQSVFSAVGYDDASTCAWAVYTDGRLLMIANAPPTGAPGATAQASRVGPSRAPASPGPASLAPAVRSRGSNLSGNVPARADSDEPLLTDEQFRSVNMWPCVSTTDYLHVSESWVDEDTIPRISRIAAGLGCSVVDPGLITGVGGSARPLIADVEGLKSVKDDGVFLLTTHGGYAEREGTSVSALWTLTPVIEGGSLVEGYETDLDAGRLVYFTAPRMLCPTGTDGTPATCFGITPDFARHYGWSFPRGSLVYLNTTGDVLPEWQSVLEAAGARTLLGWEGAADVRTMLGAAQDFFELMFATNKFDGATVGAQLSATPRCRNYGVEAIYSYLHEQGLIDGIEVGGQAGSLQLFQSEFVDQIRPTIEWLAIDEMNELIYIQGQFGEPEGPYEKKVRIGSDTARFDEPELALAADPPVTGEDELDWIEWLPGQITTHLPRDRDAGMVQVWVGNRFSNIAHLTRWTVVFQITRTVGGSLQRSVTMQVGFRAFVSGYRVSPDQDLTEQWGFTNIMNESEASIGWSASGSLSRSASGTTTTVAWSGAGNIGRSEPALGEHFSLIGVLRVPQRRLECMLDVRKSGGLHVETTVTSEAGTGTSEHEDDFGVSTPFAEFPSFGPLHLNFTEDWNLISGGVTFSDDEESVFGGEVCETQVIWAAVPAQFGPEDDRGGR